MGKVNSSIIPAQRSGARHVLAWEFQFWLQDKFAAFAKEEASFLRNPTEPSAVSPVPVWDYRLSNRGNSVICAVDTVKLLR
jgi:hypothetical protein